MECYKEKALEIQAGGCRGREMRLGLSILWRCVWGLLLGTLVLYADGEKGGSRPFVRGVAEIRRLESIDFLTGIDFELLGVVTLVDRARDLVVIQDEVGAIALHLPRGLLEGLDPGVRIRIWGTNGVPFVQGFADFPHRPSHVLHVPMVRLPQNFGEYYLTRFSGYLIPPESGEYVFWVASDNSSELWMSTNNSRRGIRRIAYIPRYGWTGPDEWDRYVSQKSEPIYLEAGKEYYFELFQEQTTIDSHVSLAWRGPGFPRTTISPKYLRPSKPMDNSAGVERNGLVCEVWTNFFLGDLSIIAGPQPFRSALSVEQVWFEVLGRGVWPEPFKLIPGQRLPPNENYRWVEVIGWVRFHGIGPEEELLELWDGQEVRHVRVLGGVHKNPYLVNTPLKVHGVWEAVTDLAGNILGVTVWMPFDGLVRQLGEEELGSAVMQPSDSLAAAGKGASSITRSGFYGTRGVITFHGIIGGKSLFYIQEDNAPVMVALDRPSFPPGLFKVGQLVDVAGGFYIGGAVPVIDPLVIRAVGHAPLPIPLKDPLRLPDPSSAEGRWVELEGRVQFVHSNGWFRLSTGSGTVLIAPADHLAHSNLNLVNAYTRVRGVITWQLTNEAVLLVPSLSFISIVERDDTQPWELPLQSIVSLYQENKPFWQKSWIRVKGVVTCTVSNSFFLQDNTAGVLVAANESPMVRIGDEIEVVGFPKGMGQAVHLVFPLIRVVGIASEPRPEPLLDNEGGTGSKQLGKVVQVDGRVLELREDNRRMVLQLRGRQSVIDVYFQEECPKLRLLRTGGSIKANGIYWTGPVDTNFAEGIRSSVSPHFCLILRGDRDIISVSGPPWLTSGRALVLLGILGAVIGCALVVIRFLHVRLERQKALQLALSKQFLEGQETERKRIAANLHDGLGQNLLVIKNHLHMMQESVSNLPTLQTKLEMLQEVVSEAVDEVRRIINDLRPWQLDQLGLRCAVAALVDHAARTTNIDFACNVDGLDAIADREHEIHIYRIIQEGINNIIKHSGATEAVVVASVQDGSLRISIRDNGKGFDPHSIEEAMLNGTGHGLRTVSERVRILGGQWKVDSEPGSGTRLTIEIPLKK